MRRRVRGALGVSCLLVTAGAALIGWLALAGTAMEGSHGSWDEDILDHFWNKGLIKTRDGLEIKWEHAVNSRDKLNRALEGNAHMIEADILLRGSNDGEPIMAHPPATDSDINLKDWLTEVSTSNKGIKLDFKSLESVLPSMKILHMLKKIINQPVWINADILPGPGGTAKPVDVKEFLQTVASVFPDVTLSLGWTTGWLPDKNNEGYSWEMVREMEDICNALSQPVTFPVRAALVRQSWLQIQWLLQTSNRYSLTIWAGKDDVYSVDDLLYIREHTKQHQIFYDLFDPQNSQLKEIVEHKVKQDLS